jgi:hypothetical protein
LCLPERTAAATPLCRYGSFGNCARNPADAKYMQHLLGLAQAAFGQRVLYSTIDGAGHLGAGSPWKV